MLLASGVLGVACIVLFKRVRPQIWANRAANFVIPPYADSFPFVLRKPDSCHRAQLSPLILEVITDLGNFTSCVWHNHL